MSLLISEFVLPIDTDTFIDIFWSDSSWFNRFLTEKLEDLNVLVGEWECLENSNSNCDSNNITNKTRNIRSYHPSKLSFPGLPSHAESLKSQIITYVKDAREGKVVIQESNSFRGIPYSDYFSVNTEWIAVSSSKPNSNHDIEGGNICLQQECSVSIYLEMVFHKYTWLRGTIESNTKAELITVYEQWLMLANECITKRKIHSKLSSNTITTHNIYNNIYNNIHNFNEENIEIDYLSDINIEEEEAAEDVCIPSDDVFMAIDENINLANLLSFVSGVDINNNANTSHTNSISNNMNNNYKIDQSRVSSSLFYEDDDMDEDLQFYDCETEGTTQQHTINITALKNNSSSINTQVEELNGIFEDDPSSDRQSNYFTRDTAISIVETGFVLVQFTYWKVHNFYNCELKELFNISPAMISLRILNSFIPGWHSSLLMHPDLYGPLIAVFLLPQSVLLCMDISKNGCSQADVLGNGVVVSLCLWLGLSSLYRLLAFVLAPTIDIRHCLSMTGYSFFAWNLALLCTYPLERYQDFIGLPIALPLALFGIPSALAQGFMFWDQTPASSLTLQPHSFPSSLQHFAQNNSRWIQRLIWAIPKLIALVIVAGMHYQFLWYVARVFLPGRKQQCKLSALVQPSQYADIITQKELRKYALLLLNRYNEDDE